jgi:hypothetical protein
MGKEHRDRSRSPRSDKKGDDIAMRTSFKAEISEIQKDQDLVLGIRQIQPLNMPCIHSVLGYKEHFEPKLRRLRVAKGRTEAQHMFQVGETIIAWNAVFCNHEADIAEMDHEATVLWDSSDKESWLELFAGIGGFAMALRAVNQKVGLAVEFDEEVAAQYAFLHPTHEICCAKHLHTSELGKIQELLQANMGTSVPTIL